jgi:ClpP class serine protease
MKINFQLAKEIYGFTPWLVDAHSFPALSALLDNARSGVEMEMPEQKYNSISLYDINSATKVVDRPYGPYWSPGQLDSKESFEAIGVVNINGPITVSGGMSSYGIDYISSNMKKMAADDRIKGFVIVANSGGGSSMAVEIMTETIAEIRKTKPVNSVISKGGMAASAMYGILAATGKIYSEHEMNIVGSAGTMVEFDGRKANTEDPNGVKHIRIYASKSTEKNKAFEEALNHDNYKIIIDEMLDPINERFLNKMVENRPALKGTGYDNGHTKFSKDSVGTFIDGLKSFNEVVEETMVEYKSDFAKPTNKNNQNNNSKIQNKMTVDELKQQHPETYNSIFNAGVASEKDRVGTWMAHSTTDPEMVSKGIESGLAITGAQREQLIVKAASSARVAKMENDAPQTGTTPASTTATEEVAEEEKEATEFYANILK